MDVGSLTDCNGPIAIPQIAFKRGRRFIDGSAGGSGRSVTPTMALLLQVEPPRVSWKPVGLSQTLTTAASLASFHIVNDCRSVKSVRKVNDSF